MLRNQVFTDFNLELNRDLFNDDLLKIYDVVINFIHTASKYNLEFWKSIWIKVSETQSMLLILINPKYEYQEELNKLVNSLEVDSFYYQFRENKRKPDKEENIFLMKGQDTIYEKINGFKFHLSPYSFCQSNNIFSNLLYNQIANILKNQLIKFNKLFIFGRTSSPISILTKDYFDKISCIIPCPITNQNMLLDLKENKITNVFNIYQKKEDIILIDEKDYLLFLSPGMQGLPKNILNQISNLKHISKIFLLSCNLRKTLKDLDYLKTINNFEINQIHHIQKFIQVYEILLIHQNL